MQKLLIVGAGDIARRVFPRLKRQYHVYVLLRNSARALDWRNRGAKPVIADLDNPNSLERLSGIADLVLHFAPPSNDGIRDLRTRRLLAAFGKGKSLPRRLVYISTTGVYGDCAGAWIDETRILSPRTLRAQRRVDAENTLRSWGRQCGVQTVILRVPGIYAEDRLPLDYLHNGLPALKVDDDVYSNHIHADDLANICIAALRYGMPNRVYNVVDDSMLLMADYFEKVADAFALPRPTRVSRDIAEKVMSSAWMSYLSESRRIINQRIKKELKVCLAYPTIDDGLVEALARRSRC